MGTPDYRAAGALFFGDVHRIANLDHRDSTTACRLASAARRPADCVNVENVVWLAWGSDNGQRAPGRTTENWVITPTLSWLPWLRLWGLFGPIYVIRLGAAVCDARTITDVASPSLGSV